MSDPADILLIIGLGNPGDRYADTRHNAGFWFADALCDAARGSFRTENKFHGELARVKLSGRDLMLLKPGTFMNRSGLAAQAVSAYYKIAPDRILVAHDELDLPAGTVRLKLGGGHGGHNGLRDLHRVFGEGYRRLRIGIGHPGDKHLVLDYVLGRPSRADEDAIRDGIARSLPAIDTWLSQSWDKALQQLHTP